MDINNFILIKENNFQKIRNEINKNKGKEIIFFGRDDELNRKILEKEYINALLLNLSEKKDRFKQRDSGFNQVLARIAKKKNVCIGINFDEIIESKNLMEKSQILARIKQNVKLCNKNKLKMKFIIINSKNKRNVYDLRAFGLALGMPTWMIRDFN